jgi:hypothetical protein
MDGHHTSIRLRSSVVLRMRSSAGVHPQLIILALTWLVSATYVWHYLDRGWWPNNAGAFSMSALRVHDGELPHRDFDEIYTGGTSYLHALAFDVLGTTIATPRRVLFLVFLTWVPSFYFIAARFSRRWVAGLFTLLAVTWSLPIYSEPVASWYNLFLATHGLAAMACYFDGHRRGWLFVAGVCGGLSVLAKIVGLCFLAAAVLSLVFHAAYQRMAARSNSSPEGTARGKPSSFALFIAVSLSASVVITGVIIARGAGRWGFLHLALPVGAVAVVAIVNEFRSRPVPFLGSVAVVWALAWPLALGTLGVVLPYVLAFAFSGSLSDLVRGLFVDPQARLSVTANPPPPVSWAALPLMLALAWPWRWPRASGLALGAFLAVPAVLLIADGRGPTSYPAVIGAIRILLPCAVIAGAIGFLRRPSSEQVDPSASTRFAVLTVAAMCALVQFPVAETIYIFFAAPLGLLAVLVSADMRALASRILVVGAAATLLAFSVLWVDRSLHLGVPRPPFVRDNQRYPLEIDRAGGIRVSRADKFQYEQLVKFVRRVARSEYIYATPDCAEVYFLAGFKNPTRTTYDFFDNPNGRVERIKRALEDHEVNAVVINQNPQYSPSPPAELMSWFEQRYSWSFRIGAFQIRWRGELPPDSSAALPIVDGHR